MFQFQALPNVMSQKSSKFTLHAMIYHFVRRIANYGKVESFLNNNKLITKQPLVSLMHANEIKSFSFRSI